MNINQIKKLMERKKTAHKGDNGNLLIIGGSEDYVGAPALAGLAALRAGCDSVTIAAPEKVAWAINKLSPDLITKKFSGAYFTLKHAKELLRLSEKFDAVLIGNGMTRKADRCILYFVRKSMKPKVIDADALKALSFKEPHNSILTPHFAELEQMLVNSKKEFLLPKLRVSNPKEIADTLQGNLKYFLQNENVILIKKATDIIISRNKISLNKTGNPGMAKAGTGDVLAGLAAGFLAKTKDQFKSACAAAYLNGYVGDMLLKKKKGYSFIASDLVEDLGKINKSLKLK
ncbi:MAG: NAD(P)H-hydrate dehydratase [Candidatus Woesearchaeota archaeon]